MVELTWTWTLRLQFTLFFFFRTQKNDRVWRIAGRMHFRHSLSHNSCWRRQTLRCLQEFPFCRRFRRRLESISPFRFSFHWLYHLTFSFSCQRSNQKISLSRSLRSPYHHRQWSEGMLLFSVTVGFIICIVKIWILDWLLCKKLLLIKPWNWIQWNAELSIG